MRLPVPVPGLVTRYRFLWSHKAEPGAEGDKDRPCAVVVAAPHRPTGHIRTLVVPITHSRPIDRDASMELPGRVAKLLGLDDELHWIRLDELNRFAWPGYDLSPIPGRNEYAYGMLPKPLFDELKRRILALAEARRTRTQARD